MQRIYLQTTHLGDNQIILEDNNIIYQLSKILRSKIGDEIIFFNGLNFIDFVYKIISINKKNIIFSLKEKINKNLKNKDLILYQSLPNKIDKIELILQKGAEIGYNEFIFFRSKRSQNLNLSQNKIKRFEKIVIEAIEQSGGNNIPKLSFFDGLNLNNILGEKLYFHTEKNNSTKLKELILKKEKINIFIGPEGGFNQEEINNFDENGFNKIYLGDNILRTETASIVVGFYISQV